MLRTTLFALALVLAASPAFAGDPPYLKLAQRLGTPELADSTGASDKSWLYLHFVPKGEDTKTWTKLTTVSILKIPPADTETATRGVIGQLRTELKTRKATVDVFDESPVAPVTCFFEFTAGGETDRGVIYSPDPGFVTVAQLGVRGGASMGPDDVKLLKSLIGS